MDIHIEPSVWYTIPVFGGIPVTDAVFVTWLVMAILIVFGLVVRFVLLPKFEDLPKGFQNILELFVEWIYHFCEDTMHERGRGIAPYIGTIALYLALANTIELIGLRPPTTNLGVTFALAIMTFILINYYGIRKKGVLGRLKDFTKPVAIMAPIKFFSELAIPVSMASRLFGNILGGLVVMEIIYKVVPVAVPAALAIYFNLFDGLMQTFIFITLTLSFIGDALE